MSTINTIIRVSFVLVFSTKSDTPYWNGIFNIFLRTGKLLELKARHSQFDIGSRQKLKNKICINTNRLKKFT